MRFLITIIVAALTTACHSFISLPVLQQQQHGVVLFAASKGFGAGSTNKKSGSKKKKRNKKPSIINVMEDKPRAKKVAGSTPFVKSEQEQLIEQLAAATADNPIGRAVASSPLAGTEEMDPFWQLMPSLISSRFPNAKDDDLKRVAGMVRHAVNPDNRSVFQDWVDHPDRPQHEIHAYMPDLGEPQPFLNPEKLELCQKLSNNYDVILQEYEALLKDHQDRFQSVTSMNYDAGWRTLVLFYNGHRIPDFPYHLCPVTTSLLESVPLAGRIAGFNRQQPQSGIPRHTDGNNMWLTCQMGLEIPPDDMAYIQVAQDTRHWKEGECLLYDTTYEHETYNASPDQERVVLHVDFFNTLTMTPLEIEIMQYIYTLREEFMKAEGVSKVGAQIL